jgi:exonuclease III
MTSLFPFSSRLRSLRILVDKSTIVCHNYASMNREISPPSAKRRKTTAGPAVTIARQTPSTPQALPPLATNTLRIFSWNINGITPFLQAPITSFFPISKPQNDQKASVPPASLRGFLQRHTWPSILFLQEVKIAAKDSKTQDSVRNAINAKLPADNGPTYEAHFTLPTDPHNARGPRGSGKVYGVTTILRSDLRTQYEVNVRTVEWDTEGRISVLELTSRSATNKTKLACFNIYAVNGTSNPYRNAKGVVTGTRHTRKLAVHALLSAECIALEEKGWHVLLAGDMNIARIWRDGYPKLRVFPMDHVVNRTDFHDKLLKGNEGFKGVDVWRELHGEERRYTYFPRGREWGASCDRVDFVVAGRDMVEKGMVRACGIMDSEAERGPSDHVPIWVDVGVGGEDAESTVQ